MWDISELNLSFLFFSEIDRYIKRQPEFFDKKILSSHLCVFFRSVFPLSLVRQPATFLVKTIKYPRKKLSNPIRAKFRQLLKARFYLILAANYNRSNRQRAHKTFYNTEVSILE